MSSLADAVVELASIPAPTFHEQDRLEWVERRLEGRPGRRHRDEVGNLVWAWGDGAQPPAVLLMAHLDTVFPAETPLRFERRDGDLVGPGIGDNAAAVVVAIEAAASVLEHASVAPGAVAFTVGEEGLGNLRGALAACRALAPDCAIALEGQGLEEVRVDAVGSVRVRLVVHGPGGHSWADRGSPSAVHELIRLAAPLVDQGTPDVPVNVGLIEGGRSVNAIADRAESVVEARALDEPALAQFRRAIEALTVDDPLRLETTVVGHRPAGRLERGHRLLAVVEQVRDDLGLPRARGEASTDANAALACGIPALALGVSYGGGMHTLHERIDVASLELGCAQVTRVLERLLVREETA
jgi:acetylornithine deacetylase/succinyl-diaminopimelate desuccinylase-like protein